MREYQTKIITSDEGLEHLRSDWDRIHQSSLRATPFNSWAWMATWWQVYRRRHWQLHVVCVVSGDGIVGIVPLYVQSSWHGRTLRFLGTGEPEEDEVVTEYCDVLADPQFEAKVLLAAWQSLGDDDWSSFHTWNLLADSLVARAAADSVWRRPCGVRYRMTLPATWDAFLATCSANMRRQIRTATRDAAKAEASEAVFTDWNDGGAEAFEALCVLHQSRWEGKDAPGAFASTAFCDFHREIIRQHAVATGSEIRLIRSHGEPLAALYNFRLRDTVYFYQSGVSPDAHFRSPGVFSHARAIMSAIDDGIAFYDMMRGDVTSYKRRFPCEITGMESVSVYRSSARAHLVRQRQKLYEWLHSSVMSKQKN